MDAVGVEAEPLDHAGADELADHDHPVGARARRGRTRAGGRARSPREKSCGRSRCCTSSRVSTVGPRGTGQGHGERVVHDVGPRRARSRSGAGPQRRARPIAARRPGVVVDAPVPGATTVGKPAAGVRRERRHERLVLVLARRARARGRARARTSRCRPRCRARASGAGAPTRTADDPTLARRHTPDGAAVRPGLHSCRAARTSA